MVGRLNCGPCEAMWWRGVAVVGLMVMAARLIRFLFFSAQHPIAEGWTVALVVFIMSFKLIHRWVYLRSLFHQDHGHLAALLYSLGDTFTQDVSLDDEKDDDNTSLSPSPESCLGSVPALRNCMGCFFTYAGRCGFNGGLIADKRERGLRKSLTDEPSFDPVPVQNSAPATEEGRAAAEEQDGEAKASGPTTDSSTRGHHLQLPASAKVRELRGAFSEMVSGMGVILLAISMWLCWVTVMGGARRDAVGALLDVIAAAWYLVFVRVPSCLDFLRRPSINQSIMLFVSPRQGFIMLTSCMLWDTVIMNIYPTLAKAEIQAQFSRFYTEGLQRDLRMPFNQSCVGTPLDGIEQGFGGSGGGSSGLSDLQETLDGLSFLAIKKMNANLADHENVTQALENFNTVVLVYGLSNLEKLGYTDLFAHIILTLTFMFLSFSALYALAEIDGCFADEVMK